MCEFKSKESETEEGESGRTPIDIVCILDRSGSMNGNKW